MHKVNLRDIPELEQRSPTGKFHSFARNLSLALGGGRNAGTWGGGHPFDLQLRRVPAGAAVCPYHAHLAQWEFFLVRRGTGTVRVGDERHAVRAGDCFIHPPGEAHQLLNTGAEELEVLIVADNPQLDAFVYPDSQKWGLRPPGQFFTLTPTDYFTGEDEPPAGAPVAPPAPLPAELSPAALAPIVAPRSPFAQRLVNVDALAWEDWQSPRGRYHVACRGLSLALGAQHRAPLNAGGHPFDVELGRVPVGAAGYPCHWHALQWEFYLFVEGRGEFRLGEERFAVEAGDAVLAAPFAAHGFRNTGDTDLLYLCVADDPPADYWHQPDSGKFGCSHPRQYFRTQLADFTDGEE